MNQAATDQRAADQQPAELLTRHVPAGAGADNTYELSITPERAGWAYSGLRVLTIPAGGSHDFVTGSDEVIVLPLSGALTVSCSQATYDLTGRENVFAAVTDFVYLPINTVATLRADGQVRVALAAARATQQLQPRYVPASDVAVELRGAGTASRQVNNFCAPDAFAADRIIAVEVLTPGGNWSSYPPHKHDQHSDTESQLEEIYYFEVRNNGPAYQRVYASRAEAPIDVCAEIRSGDAVLIPHGYHGPSMAAPGYDMYYLNVMAGPGERVWQFCDDPSFAWIRDSWSGQPIDARLPMSGAI